MKVLIVGCRGVGIETAKNLALQGVGAITLVDPAATRMQDTGANFFLFESDTAAGTSRAAASASRLQELNPICVVRHEAALSHDLIRAHSALVVTQFKPLPELVELDEFCRENRVGFFYAYTGGVSASVFVDLGPNHIVHDSNGERPIKKIITKIVPHAEGGSLVHYETPDGGNADAIDEGVFEVSEVLGVDGINNGIFHVQHNANKDPAKTVRVPFASDQPYCGGGLLTEKKEPKPYNMHSLACKLREPGNTWEGTLVQTDLLSFSEVQQHIAFAAIASFAAKHGRFPLVGAAGEADVAEVVETARGLLTAKEIEAGEGVEVDAALVARTARHSASELQPMCAFIGGVLAQEVVKVTGKFTPIPGFMHFSCPEVLPAEAPAAADTQPRGHRNDELAAIFGWTFVEQLGNLKYFMVGCGALGCEFMKNFALNGIFCGPEGKLVVTDGDRIELSNLSRQFLFREHNVGQPKSRAAGAMATVMNPGFKIEALELFVGAKTEDKFNDDFWMGLDGVCNALDNMEARLYVDQQCVRYEKSLLESGTMGTSGNVDTICPHKTRTYKDGGEAAAGGGVPMCTLRNFPHLTDHCIEWSRDIFDLLFVKLGKSGEAYLANPEAFEAKKLAEADFSATSFDIKTVHSLLKAAKAPSMESAAQLAFDMFHYLFRDRIQLLIQENPRDARNYDDNKRDIGPFWSEKKRFPTAAVYNPQDEAHTSFMLSATCLFAVLLGVVPPKKEDDDKWLAEFRSQDNAWIKQITARLTPPAYTPAPVPANPEDKAAAVQEAFASMLQQLRAEGEGLMLPPLEPADFEKDDDINFHIAFTTAAANLRCDNYELKRTDFQACKVIAGKIIAAIATTTAAVCGLVMLELIKLVQGKGTDDIMNRQVGLGTNVYTSFSQEPPKKFKTHTELVKPTVEDAPPEAFDAEGKIKADFGEPTVRMAYPEGHTVWDKLACPASTTLRDFIQWLLTEHGIKFSTWDFVVGAKKNAEGVMEGKTTPLYPPAPILDYALLPPLDLAKGQAMMALNKIPEARKDVQKYLQLWEKCKTAGAVPPQPPVDPEAVTLDWTMLDVLRKMSSLGDRMVAAGEIQQKAVEGLEGRRFWVLRTEETGPAALVHAESMDDIAHMVPIKFTF